jgi:hypothetical protein
MARRRTHCGSLFTTAARSSAIACDYGRGGASARAFDGRASAQRDSDQVRLSRLEA